MSRFFLRGKERTILDGIYEHLAQARATFDKLAALVGAVAAGDDARSDALMGEVMEAESKADAIHRELSTKIAEGAFFGGVREDFLNLLEAIDSIADAAKDAARLLVIDRIRDTRALSILSSENAGVFLQNLGSAVDALTDLIKGFEIDKKTIVSRVHRVEEFEELADGRKDALLRELFAFPRIGDTLAVIQLRDFLFAADDVADNAEDASDVVLVLVAKGYA